MPTTAMPIALIVAAAAGAAAMLALHRTRRALRAGWQELRSVRAMRSLSQAALARAATPEALDRLLPAMSAITGTVTAVWMPAQAGKKSRVRVSSPANLQDDSTRSAAALLAALSLAGDELPVLSEALGSREPRVGANVLDLLRAGGSALPAVTRERLQVKVKPTPFFIAPVVRAGRAIALLIAIAENGATAMVGGRLRRAAGRFGLALDLPEETPNGRARRPAHPAARRRPAPRDAEIVLWLDPQGKVVACEPLQDDWLLDPPPDSLQQISDDTGEARAIMARAREEGETPPRQAILPGGTAASMSLLALSDIDGNLWGYAALLRRAEPASTSRASQPARHAR